MEVTPGKANGTCLARKLCPPCDKPRMQRIVVYGLYMCIKRWIEALQSSRQWHHLADSCLSCGDPVYFGFAVAVLTTGVNLRLHENMELSTMGWLGYGSFPLSVNNTELSLQ